MSRLYFHAEHETVEVYGSEIAWCRVLVGRVAEGVFDLLSPEQKRALVPTEGNQDLLMNVDRRLSLTLRPGFDERFPDGTKIGETVLNTALAVGSPALRLCARLSGQCEIHAYCEPRNLGWLATTIEEGLETGVLREMLPSAVGHPTGWREVIALLGRAKGPVVTSYSICDEFPNESVAAFTPPPCTACAGANDECEECGGEPLWDAWYDLPKAERWRNAMVGLRKRSETEGLELAPGPWVGFGELKSAFDYMRC